MRQSPVSSPLIRPASSGRFFVMECRETPVRDALAALFAFHKVKYALDPNVNGTVHLKLSQTTLEESLQLLCRYNTPRLLYRKSGDMFIIEPRPETAPVEVMRAVSPTPSTQPSVLKISPVKPANKQEKLEERRVWVEAKNAPVRAVLTTYFDAFGLDFIIAPEVQGTVTTFCDNQYFDQALRQLLRASTTAITYNREGRRFYVRTRIPVG
jgi:type II secretory pathway component HofQ